MDHDRPCGCKHAKQETIERLTVRPREEPLPEPWRAQIEGGELILQVVPQGEGQVLELSLRRTWPVRDNAHAGRQLRRWRSELRVDLVDALGRMLATTDAPELRADSLAALGRLLETRAPRGPKGRRSEIVEPLHTPEAEPQQKRFVPSAGPQPDEPTEASSSTWNPILGNSPRWRDAAGRVLALRREGRLVCLTLDGEVLERFEREDEAIEEAQRFMEGRS